MHRALTFALSIPLAVLVSGCGLSSVAIHSEALSFGGVIEDTTNKLLVINVLRARDKAPLHFADIPVVRESIQQTASFSLLQFLGRRLPTQTTDSLTAGAGIQVTPSFEISHLHSKEFITGITSPIDPRVVKYWLDRGLDRRIALLLFFSAVEIVETRSEAGPAHTIRIQNSPRDAVDVIRGRKQAEANEALRCDTQSDFERYLKLFNTLETFSAHSYRERRLLARDINPGAAGDSRNLQAFAALDQSRVQLVYDRERNSYSLYSLSSEQKVAFCFLHDQYIEAGGPAIRDRRSCYQSVVDVGAEDPVRRAISPLPVRTPKAGPVAEPSPYCRIFNQFTAPHLAAKSGDYPKLELRLYIRSVGEIFQFLGDLLYYQEEVKRHLEGNAHPKLKLNSPVTFGYCETQEERDRDRGCDDIFLRLDGDPCNARFSLFYRDRQYHVGNYDPPGAQAGQGASCRPDSAQRKDHTLEILAVLHQLVGLNKSASDIRGTPAVQVLP